MTSNLVNIKLVRIPSLAVKVPLQYTYAAQLIVKLDSFVQTSRMTEAISDLLTASIS